MKPKLIDACNRSDEESWETLYKAYGKVVWGYLQGRSSARGKKEEMEDITQRVFIKLYKGGLKNFRGTTRYEFLKYLQQITMNEKSTYFRLKAKEEKEVSIDQGTEYEEEQDIISNVTTEAPSPEEEAIIKERKQIVETHLKNLPLEDQQIFIMIAMNEYKYKEAGQRLGIPDGTVASRYSRIREKLEKGLKEFLKRER